MSEGKEPLSVVAVVSMNGGEALVLNRPLELVYEKMPNGDYVGEDGPFKSLMFFRHGSGSFKAFSGREFALKMKDGTLDKIKNHWWHGLLKNTQSVVACDIASLKKCYVFSGGFSVNKEEFDALRSTYTGPVYPYWDYEKIIKFDDMRNDLYKRLWHEEKRVKALIEEVKKHHGQAAELERRRDALVAECHRAKNLLSKIHEESYDSGHEFGKSVYEKDTNFDIQDFIENQSEVGTSTPATDAALREIGAKAVEKLATFAGKEYQRFAGDKANQRRWKGIVLLCTSFAQQLREGKV